MDPENRDWLAFKDMMISLMKVPYHLFQSEEFSS